MRERADVLSFLTADPPRTGIFTDFDGTLSAIVARPEDAMPSSGSVGVLEQLASKFGLIAVVSGRSLADLSTRVQADGVLLAGSYGRERSDRPPSIEDRDWTTVEVDAVDAVAAIGRGVRVERKASGVALHYRAAPELRDGVRAIAESLATGYGLEIKPGRMVFELVSPGPGKGEAVLALVAERSIERVLMAGDDWGDLEAFLKLRASGVAAVTVAVSSPESPPSLTDVADLVVHSPSELVDLLRELADQS